MAKKAVYNNQHLAIYITQEDFEKLINEMAIFLPAYIGKDKVGIGTVQVVIDTMTKLSYQYALSAERQAVKEVQDQFAKDHPDYESSTKTQDRRRHARK